MKRVIVVLFLLFLCAVSPVFGSEKFNNSFLVTYEVSQSGLTSVTEDITITNKTSDYYPSEQTFTYSSLNIGNIKAIDEKGEFDPEITKDGNKTTVKVVFRTKNAGLGKQTNIRLEYQTSDMASLNGEVWQILIPGIKNIDFYDDFNLNLFVPQTFPEIQYVSVPPETPPAKKIGAGWTWQWSKDEIKDRGIVLIFGKNQYYRLSMDYSLKNTGMSPLLNSITVPPDTNYQKMILTSIKPEPVYAEEDYDGNWIFWFNVNAQETKKIRAEALVNLFFEPEPVSKPNSNQIHTWTSVQRFWDYQKLADASGKLDNLKTTRAIYDFTVNTLQYNFNRLNKAPERFTASDALKNPGNSICTDFTNVFISLARKNGIPAREVDGFAYTSNYELQPLSLEKDILHAWPEYYDFKKQTWIMVDPTWEKTTGGIDYFDKLDLNHITFVKKGLSSEQPYPPGSYKSDDLHTKDVRVTFAKKEEWDEIDNQMSSNKKIDLIYEVSDFHISGISEKGKIILQNKSGITVESIPVVFNIGDKRFDREINRLIPFQNYEFEFTMPKVNFWEKKDIELTTLINNKSFKKTVHFTPIYLWKDNVYVFSGGLSIIILCFVIIVYSVVRRK